ncbi:MAG: hypothetical protein P4L75_03545 [Clostridia bacterium]|nr:hypothetical protein [Clostridia bacterium]MDR3645420.1 hypothetical protein [Clostridia bacterium]
MDVFVEHMVTRKNSPIDMLKMFLLTVAGVVLVFVIFLVMSQLPSFAFLFLLAIFGACWGWWHLMTSFRVEFEYTLTNGEMDVDKIVAQRKRKRLITVNLREIEIMAPMNGDHQRDFENHSLKTKIDASSSPQSPKAYFLIVNHDKQGLTRLIFEPDERILSGAKMVAARKVFGQ